MNETDSLDLYIAYYRFADKRRIDPFLVNINCYIYTFYDIHYILC